MTLPETDHVLRYLRPSAFIEDNNLGKGFMPRGGEVGVSVNHMEYFNENAVAKIKQLSRIKYATTGKLAKINIGETKAYIKQEMALDLDFISDALGAKEDFLPDPSHALIMNIPRENTPEAQMIAMLLTDKVIELYPTQ